MVSTTIEIKQEEYKKVSIFHRFLHNNRLHQKCKNSIFDRKYNYVKNYQFFNNEDEITKEEEELKKFVKRKTKKKSQIENHILESTINISDDKEIENLSDEEKQKFLIEKTEKYINTLKEKYGIKIYQYRLHMDEGHKNENDEIKRNIHIHLIHSNITKDGKSFTREIYQESHQKYHKKGIHVIQDIVSKEFELSRGELNSEQKHLNKEQYKNMIIQSKKQREKKIKEIELEFKEKENELNKNFELKKEEIEKMTFTQFLKVKDEKYQMEITKLKNDYEEEKTKKISQLKEISVEKYKKMEEENELLKEQNEDLNEKNDILTSMFTYFSKLYKENFNGYKDIEIFNIIKNKLEIDKEVNEYNKKMIETKDNIINTLKDKYQYVKNLFEYKDEEDIKREKNEKNCNDLNKEVNIPKKMEDNKEEDKKVIVEYKGERGYFTEEVETDKFGNFERIKKTFIKIGK